MVYVKWTFWTVFWLFLASFLHYTLPQNDIIRVVNTDVRRIDFGENSIFWARADTGQDPTAVNRDIFFIDGFYENGRPMVYRNEDTGWGWPPYFKLDSANLQAEARDLVSTSAAPQWVRVRHYGWRNEIISIYPNAISVRAVEGPDVRIIPWFNIVILTILAAVFWAIWVRWRRFRARRIDPVLAEVGESLDDAGDRVSETGGRIKRWFGSWRSK